MTVGVWQALATRDQQLTDDALQDEVETRAQAIERGLADIRGAAEAGTAYFTGSERVEREEWPAFAYPLLEHKPTVLSLQWAPRVMEDAEPLDHERWLPRPHYPIRREAHEAVVQAEIEDRKPILEFDRQTNELTEAATRSEYFPLMYQATVERPQWEEGFDWASEPTVWEAMKRSVQMGEPALSRPLPDQLGEVLAYQANTMLLVAPIFFKAGDIESIELPQERREKLRGFVLVIFRVDELIEHAIGYVPIAGVDMHVFKVSEDADPILLQFQPSRWRSDPITPFLNPTEPESGLHMVEELELSGQRWQVHITPAPHFLTRHRGWTPQITLASGLLFTTLLTVYVGSMVNRSAQIQSEVSLRTDELRRANESLHREITERERADRAIQKSEQRYRTLASTAVDAIVLADQSGNISYFNASAEGMFGYSQEEAVGQPLTILMPPRYHQAHWEGLARYMTTREPKLIGTTVEMVARHKSGREFPVEISLAVHDQDGESVFTGIMRDISERKQAEAEQQKLTEALQRSNRELEQFAYIASHDLQEPLRKIEGFGQMLQEHIGKQLDEEGSDYLTRMSSATHRMRDLIDGLLTYSRVTTKQRPLETVDLNEVAQEVVSDLEMSIGETGGQVTIDSLPTVQADPLQMRQLLQNLIGNALKFHKPDQLPHVKVYAVAASANGESEKNHCQIRVEDEGIGIDPEDAKRLFMPFRRLHGRGSPYKGTGIGLAVCRKIAERHGGTIDLKSTFGEGSTFIVKLPVETPPSTTQEGRES